MPFKPGQTGNPGGRPKGAKNKLTAEYKEKIHKLFASYTDEEMEADLKSLKPKERLDIFSTLAEYVQPKLSRAEVKNDHTGDTVIRIIRTGPVSLPAPTPSQPAEGGTEGQEV